MQPYLNKLPAAVVELFPELAEAAGLSAATQPLAGDVSFARAEDVGALYRPASAGLPLASRDPFTVDPAVIERGLRGHADTQNALAQALGSSGVEPRSPRPDEPNFDLAWEREGTVYVAEVKSVTPQNEERQLRLGLGQVLRYRSLLGRKYTSDVRAVLVTEHELQDPSWKTLCKELDVLLLAGADVEALMHVVSKEQT